MKKLLYTLSTLYITLAYLSVHAQVISLAWLGQVHLEQVDHMHLKTVDDEDFGNMGVLEAYVHDNTHTNQMSLAKNDLGVYREIMDVAENVTKNHLYIAGNDIHGNFIRTLHFTPDTQLEPLHPAPEATPPDTLIALAISHDDRYLYAMTTNTATDSNEILVYQITPQDTLQLIQTAPAPIGTGWQRHTLLATNFKSDNFLIDLVYDLKETPGHIQPSVPGTHGGRLRKADRYPSLPGGRQARYVVTYKILPNGQLGTAHVFNYARERDSRTDRPLIRLFLDGTIRIKEMPVKIKNHHVYEIIVEHRGNRYVIIDTFYLEPATGALRLYKSTRKRINPHENIETEDNAYRDYISKEAYFENQKFTLPEFWRSLIGGDIVEALKQKARSLHHLPGGGTLRDIDKIIAEYVTGTAPYEPNPQDAPEQQQQ